MLGLRFCARAFSSCGKRGPLFITVHGPLTVAASLVAEYRLQTRKLSNCGSRAQLLRGMWDLPRPGLKPVSPALAGRFSTTVSPGKPCIKLFLMSSLASPLENKEKMWFLPFNAIFQTEPSVMKMEEINKSFPGNGDYHHFCVFCHCIDCSCHQQL